VFVAAAATTVVVVWLVGWMRPTPPASGVVDGSAPPVTPAPSPSTPSSPAPSAAAESPSPAVDASPSPDGPSPAPAADPVLIGAGDIARCGSNDDEQSARLVTRNEGIVFTLGDNAYPNGSPSDYRNCYDPSWGRVKDRTELPVPGNHDYRTANAAGYRDYFGRRATPDGDTWYSRDIGDWHVIVLDGTCEDVPGGCGGGSPQLRWLRQDLRASDARCTLALWHQPRFSSGEEHGNDPSVAPFWEALYDAGADLVINGHDHDYERFAPQDPRGNRDRERGITQIVAGTGGGELRGLGETQPNSLVRRGRLVGVIQVTLHADGWSTRFLSADGSFEDESSGTCH
jgi:hypothetical protein